MIEERRRKTVVETAMVVECSARKCRVFTTFAWMDSIMLISIFELQVARRARLLRSGDVVRRSL